MSDESSGPWDQIKKAAGDRLSDHFIGSFVLFFIVDNWKSIVYATSGLAPDLKIEAISNQLFGSWCHVGYSFGMPLLMTLAYYFGWPFVSTQLNRFKRWRHIGDHNLAVRQESKRQPESHNLDILINDINEHIDEINALKRQVRGLRMATFVVSGKRAFLEENSQQTRRNYVKLLEELEHFSENVALQDSLGGTKDLSGLENTPPNLTEFIKRDSGHLRDKFPYSPSNKVTRENYFGL